MLKIPLYVFSNFRINRSLKSGKRYARISIWFKFSLVSIIKYVNINKMKGKNLQLLMIP